MSWPLATWLTPAVAMLVFGLMIFGTVAEPLGGRTVFVAVGTATLCLAAGIFMIVRAGPRGRGVGVALVAGGVLSGGLGVWTLLR